METELSEVAPGYVSTAEAARALGVLRTSVNHLLQSGRLQGKKIGRMWFIDKESLEAYDREVKAHPERGGRHRLST